MLTGVPVALVHLIQTEIGRSTNSANGQPAQRAMRTARSSSERRRRQIANAIVVVALANIVTGLIAWMERNNTLGAASAGCAVLLTLAIFAFAHPGRPRRPPSERK